jgi:uncharacterized protein YjdB
VLLSGNYDVKAFGKPYKFQVFIDHSVIDVFINDAAAFSNRIYPTLPASEAVELFSQGGPTTFSSLESWTMHQTASTPAPVTPGLPVTGIALNKAPQCLAADHKTGLFAAVQPANAGNKRVSWVSSNPAVATVGSGLGGESRRSGNLTGKRGAPR